MSTGARAAATVFPPATTMAQEAAPPAQRTPAAAPEPICLADFKQLAKAKMPAMAWEYVNAGASDELTVRWNKEAYPRIRLKPHVLVDVSKLDTRVTLFGEEHVGSEVDPSGGRAGHRARCRRGWRRHGAQFLFEYQPRRCGCGGKGSIVVSALRADGPRLHSRSGVTRRSWGMPGALPPGRHSDLRRAQPRNPG